MWGVLWYVRKVPILLQKSKIERRQKSRESRFLEVLSLQNSIALIRVSVVVLREMMRSLTSPRAKRIRGSRKFRASAEKDFFNTICHKRTSQLLPTVYRPTPMRAGRRRTGRTPRRSGQMKIRREVRWTERTDVDGVADIGNGGDQLRQVQDPVLGLRRWRIAGRENEKTGLLAGAELGCDGNTKPSFKMLAAAEPWGEGAGLFAEAPPNTPNARCGGALVAVTKILAISVSVSGPPLPVPQPSLLVVVR
jgi:hypothetical protein